MTYALNENLGQPERTDERTIVQKLTSDNEFLVRIFDCWGGRENVFYSLIGSQFVATGPAKILKIGQKLTFL